MHDSRCCKWLSSSPSERGSLTYFSSSALFQMLQTTFLLPIRKRKVLNTQTLVHDFKCYKHLYSGSLDREGSFPLKLRYMTPKLQTIFLLPISKGRILPTQTQVHDYRCCKRLFSGPFAHPISSAWLQMLLTIFLLTISKGGVLSTQTQEHDYRFCKRLYSGPLAIRKSSPPNL